MLNVDRLPIPDWDLSCPSCGSPLAGMKEHRCADCGERFSIRQLLGQKRPVPDLGLVCPECGYLLRGLPDNRCPECGRQFSVREMIEESAGVSGGYAAAANDPPDHHLKRREPILTGRERPLPDFGLYCSRCEWPLAGAPANTCTHCGTPFDLNEVTPSGDWVKLNGFIPQLAEPLAAGILYQDETPYLVDDTGLAWLSGGQVPFLPVTIRVPREFFWDALHALATAGERIVADNGPGWICPACKEPVPAGFDVCWQCGGERTPPGAKGD